MIAYSRQLIDEDDIRAVSEVLRGDFLTGGEKVEEFEQELCEYLGVKYACVMNSGTSALHVAYQALGLRDKDEVITTPITFAATSNALLMRGAKPIFCDIKRDGNIDENSIEKLITPNTKAIVPVDYGGNPVDIKRIKSICKKHNLYLIEDCAHALGSEIEGEKVGSFADVSIFSFHAIKPITTCGEGGALVTNSKEIYEKAKLLRSHGMIKKEGWDSDMVELGYNYRLSDVASALGISQLKKLDIFIAKRERIARFYDEAFKNNPYITSIKKALHVKSSHHLYPILLHRDLWYAKKEIYKTLHSQGIGVQVHYKPTYQFKYYKNLFGDMRLKSADEFYNSELSIPCHQQMSLEDAKFVSKSITNIIAHAVEATCSDIDYLVQDIED